MDAIKHHMGAREWTILVFLSVLRGGSFFFIDVAVETAPPFTLVLGCVALAALFLCLVLSSTGWRLPAARVQPGGFLFLSSP